MIIFFLVTAVMLALALAFVLIPLLRPRRVEALHISDESSNVSIFRAQKAELDAEVASGLITIGERDAAVAELGVRVLSEIPAHSSAQTATANSEMAQAKAEKRSWIVALCLAMSMPLAAILIYLSLGSPQGMLAARGAVAGTIAAKASVDANVNPNADAVEPPQNAENSKNPAAPPMSDKQILTMVDSLAKKMNENPSDPKGWILLARSQNALGRYPEAVAAYERAIKLVPNDSLVLADYADVLVAANNGRFDGKPYEIIMKALKLDPNNMKALALAGTAEMRMDNGGGKSGKGGNRAASLKYWQKLKTLVAKDSDDAREVDAIIAEVSGAPAGLAAPNLAPPLSPSPSPNSPPGEASGASVAAVGSKTGSNAGPAQAVSGKVTIAPELLAKIAPGDTLFVLARAAGATAGANPPRMPLAVLRIPVPQKWPYQFTLTDAMAMAPGMNLSSFPEFSIEARISKSGGAMPQPGDMSGQISPMKAGANNANITISRLVP